MVGTRSEKCIDSSRNASNASRCFQRGKGLTKEPAVAATSRAQEQRGRRISVRHLEIRFARKGNGGSNPSPSAISLGTAWSCFDRAKRRLRLSRDARAPRGGHANRLTGPPRRVHHQRRPARCSRLLGDRESGSQVRASRRRSTQQLPEGHPRAPCRTPRERRGVVDPDLVLHGVAARDAASSAERETFAAEARRLAADLRARLDLDAQVVQRPPGASGFSISTSFSGGLAIAKLA